jgi:dihydropyrimidinase
MEKIIAGGRIITESGIFDGDLLIRDEKIIAIGDNLPRYEGTEIIDATERLIMPGGVDAHVHLNLPMPGTISSEIIIQGQWQQRSAELPL